MIKKSERILVLGLGSMGSYLTHQLSRQGHLVTAIESRRELIEAEYLRQLGRHRRTDAALAGKYGMTFDEFIARRIPREKGYSWEVEQDAMDWETAIGGIATVERQLRKLRGLNDQRTA